MHISLVSVSLTNQTAGQGAIQPISNIFSISESIVSGKKIKLFLVDFFKQK
jgi:hypothetical protein